MAHYFKLVQGIDRVNKYFITWNNNKEKPVYIKTPIYIESTYELGYFFGARLTRGLSNLQKRSGQVSFRLPHGFDASKLIHCIKKSTNLDTKTFTRTSNKYTLYIANRAITRLTQEFGHGENRKLPEKYMVSYLPYLKGILDGMLDYEKISNYTSRLESPALEWLREGIVRYLDRQANI